jgi:holo-[acyl-carrier protein] synthase
MILGIGVDVVDIPRISAIIGKYGDHFLNKVYTTAEIAYCTAMATPAVHFSGRWAVKEAFYKALPRKCQEISLFKSIEVVSGSSRKPVIRVCDGKLDAALREHGVKDMHVSISHEKTVCVAFVVLS